LTHVALAKVTPSAKAGKLDLRRLQPSESYECALAYDVSPALRSAVWSLRRGLELPAPPEFQLTPHITLLYVGRLEGRSLLALDAVFRSIEPSRATVTVGGRLSAFSTGGSVVNVHLPVWPARVVRAEHRRVLRAFTAQGFAPQTPYVEERYVPHVSVVDRVNLEGWVERILERCPIGTWDVELERAAWIGRPLTSLIDTEQEGARA
jgi:2'-5' RNA ligase